MGIVDRRAKKRTLLRSPAACSAPAPRMQESRVSVLVLAFATRDVPGSGMGRHFPTM